MCRVSLSSQGSSSLLQGTGQLGIHPIDHALTSANVKRASPLDREKANSLQGLAVAATTKTLILKLRQFLQILHQL